MCTINQLKASRQKFYIQKNKKKKEDDQTNYIQFSSHFSISMQEINLKKEAKKKSSISLATTFISRISQIPRV